MKCDLIIKDNNVYVIECVPRLSGGRLCSHIIPAHSDINIVSIAVTMAIGTKQIKIESRRKEEMVNVAQRYYFPPGKEIKSHRDRGPDFIETGENIHIAIKNAENKVEEYGKSINKSI